MKCGACGNEVSQKSRYCPKCGARINQGEITDDDKTQVYWGALITEPDQRPDPDMGQTVSLKPIATPDMGQTMPLKPVSTPDRKTPIRTEKRPEITFGPGEKTDKKNAQKVQKPKRKKNYVVIGLGIGVALVAGLALGIGCLWKAEIIELPFLEKQYTVQSLIGESGYSNSNMKGETSSITETSSIAESGSLSGGEAGASQEETIKVETAEPSIKDSGDTMVSMQYCGATSMEFPKDASQFVKASSPDGVYTFQYPKDFFSTGYYDKQTKAFKFEAPDGTTKLTITEGEAPVKNDPVTCANQIMSRYSQYFLQNSDNPYTHKSSKVAESGYSRSVIAGPLVSDESVGKYIVSACTKTKVYTLTYTYVSDTADKNGFDYTPRGYVADCIYRGWSISGSTYEIRTYDQYMADVSGTKKPD